MVLIFNIFYCFRQMKCKNLKHRNVLKEIIQHKCSTIFEEARNMAKDFEMLETYKDLFIEQSKILDRLLTLKPDSQLRRA